MRLFGMTIQQRMGFIKTGSFIVLVILLCTLAAVSSEERNNGEEVFLRQLVEPASGEIDEDMVRDYNFFVLVYIFFPCVNCLRGLFS
jgi:hypothetical protein